MYKIYASSLIIYQQRGTKRSLLLPGSFEEDVRYLVGLVVAYERVSVPELVERDPGGEDILVQPDEMRLVAVQHHSQPSPLQPQRVVLLYKTVFITKGCML